MDVKQKISLPKTVETGDWDNTGHIQGIAVDVEKGYIYYSFTTKFVKSRLDGTVVGSVKGLTGHLGCITFDREDGKVYGSLEYKHDSIGNGIMKRTGATLADEDAFYIAIFDVDKIDRLDLDAEADGIMKAVYLPEVVDDYGAQNADGTLHRYGCSGIDGTAWGPVPGETDGKYRLFVAYGIYGTSERTDSENQIIMQFDTEKLAKVAKPLSQSKPHHSGLCSERRYFVYTGNTTWGIQNLEYDPYIGGYIAAVYRGKKPEYPNFPMYIIDAEKAPVYGEIPKLSGQGGYMLSLKKTCEEHESGICGLSYPYGQTGLFAVGDGRYYFSHDAKKAKEDGGKLFSSVIKLCRFDGKTFVDEE